MRIEDVKINGYVAYIGNPTRREYGIVREIRGDNVFVQYEGDQFAKATPPKYLEQLSGYPVNVFCKLP